jgi:hypothetical protein
MRKLHPDSYTDPPGIESPQALAEHFTVFFIKVTERERTRALPVYRPVDIGYSSALSFS